MTERTECSIRVPWFDDGMSICLFLTAPPPANSVVAPSTSSSFVDRDNQHSIAPSLQQVAAARLAEYVIAPFHAKAAHAVSCARRAR